ncbi:MAG TPA: hypothetical protein VEB21_15090 [Terriglobales bacterium]|nr:hypothetical protein [Terriglobales bacterium]
MSDWRRYPYTADWGDSRRFTFPACDGLQADLATSTYFVDGFLQGESTDRRYAFMAVFSDARLLWNTIRASFFTFALFDCDHGEYGTCTEYDFPRPPRIRQSHKLSLTPGRMGLRYDGSRAAGRWDSLLESEDRFRPFAWELELSGIDQNAATMKLELVLEAERPPAPLGGRELGGEVTFLGSRPVYSYFQSGLNMRGRISWGDHSEAVAGDVGWIDRQWSEVHPSTHQDRRNRRYRREWRMLQFDNGWDMTCFHQYLRPQRNAPVPWTGISAQGPQSDFELRSTHRVELTIPEYARDPGIIAPRRRVSNGPCYYPHRYQLAVPEWQMKVTSEPLVPAPAHDLPLEYWNGPVVIRGELFEQTVMGLGFDERTRPLVHDFELAEALRATIDHLPDLDADETRPLSYRLWEVEALCLRGDRRAAAGHFRAYVEPMLAKMPAEAQARVLTLAEDLLTLLS